MDPGYITTEGICRDSVLAIYETFFFTKRLILILNQIDLICIGIVVVVVAVVVFASCCMLLLLLLLLDLISKYILQHPDDGDLVLSSPCAGYSDLRL